MDSSERLRRYADLVVGVGANVQPDQSVMIQALVEHAELVRAVAEAAYVAGARRVVVDYTDDHVQRSRLLHAPADSLASFDPWEKDRYAQLRADGGAFIRLSGDPDVHLFDGIDPARLAAIPVELMRFFTDEVLFGGDVAWTIVAAPNRGWAQQVFGEPDLERLWDAVALAMRLDAADPVAAWRERAAELRDRQARLDRLGADAIRFRGPDTDLTVGLIPGSRWHSATMQTARGTTYMPNLPTEEVFTSPHRDRAEGHVRITKPLVLPSGASVSGLQLRFEAGRIVGVTADDGAAAVEAVLERDENARRLGEVSIVTGDSAVARAGLLFHNTLFDENVGCHIAFGISFPFTLPDGMRMTEDERVQAGLNHASVHVDVVIGSPEVNVDAQLPDGRLVPVLRDDRWVLEEP